MKAKAAPTKPALEIIGARIIDGSIVVNTNHGTMGIPWAMFLAAPLLLEAAKKALPALVCFNRQCPSDCVRCSGAQALRAAIKAATRQH